MTLPASRVEVSLMHLRFYMRCALKFPQQILSECFRAARYSLRTKFLSDFICVVRSRQFFKPLIEIALAPRVEVSSMHLRFFICRALKFPHQILQRLHSRRALQSPHKILERFFFVVRLSLFFHLLRDSIARRSLKRKFSFPCF